MSTEAIKTKEEYRSAAPAPLSLPSRQRIIQAAARAVEQRIWDPQFDRRGWYDAVASQSHRALKGNETIEFERELDTLIRRANEFIAIQSTDIGLFHERDRKRPKSKGFSARFQCCQANECSSTDSATWEGADIRYSHLEHGTGWLKIARFPGAIGIEIANDISAAIGELKKAKCERLIIDLRGNASGGLAFLRLMSYLTPDRLVAGYSVTRVGAGKGTPKETLKKFDWVPSQKWALPLLVVKYGLSDPSVCIVTEGLGSQPFHGRMAILVDERTTGAGERVAAFARENHLAAIVGTRTAGKLICSDSTKLGYKYSARIPARAWYTGQGQLLENVGVQPDVEGDDPLQRATELLTRQ